MPSIGNVYFSDDPSEYFDTSNSKEVLVYLYRISKVFSKNYLSTITVYDDTDEISCKANAYIKTILLPDRKKCNFPEIKTFFETCGLNIFQFSKQIDKDFWEEMLLEYRTFFTIESFDKILTSNCIRQNNLQDTVLVPVDEGYDE